MDPVDHWFASQILVHEAALMRYLARVWRNKGELHDIRQEIYTRVFKSALEKLPEFPKSFLFQVARHLLADRARRERVVSIDYTQDLEALNVLVDELSPERRLSARQELRQLSAALDELSDTCRAVIWLRRVEGLSQQEAAARLGMNEGTLESNLSRGIRALANAVFGQAPARGGDDRPAKVPGAGKESTQEGEQS
jgi:RNA polymerase sigma-70 factor (ECF subfamily)